MLTQDFNLRLKLPLGEEGAFTGYASTYGGPPDLVGDVIEPGAFAQSIQQQGANGFPLLWAHNPAEPVGTARVSDDGKGLLVNGKLLLDDPAAKRAHLHMKNGSVKGMSIGYDVPRGEGKVSYSDDGTRTLKEVKLYEISLVAIPANPRAQVTAVKSLSDVPDLLRGLRDATDPSVLAQLLAINAELTRLLGDPEDDDEEDDEDDPEEIAALKQFAASLKALAA